MANGQIIAYNGTAWINQSPQSFSQQQANWAETSTASIQYIQNKPTALSAFTNDTNYITSAGAPVQSVNGQTGTVNITTITGNSGTATTLETARTIAISGGATGTATSFNGSQNITIPVTSLDATKLSGTATINTTGSSGSCTGNAATATKATQDGNGNVITSTYSKATNLLNGSTNGSLRGINTAAEDSSYTMGINAFAEGKDTKASGYCSHAEGYSTTASGEYSHAEGTSTTASSEYSHAEGISLLS